MQVTWHDQSRSIASRLTVEARRQRGSVRRVQSREDLMTVDLYLKSMGHGLNRVHWMCLIYTVDRASYKG